MVELYGLYIIAHRKCILKAAYKAACLEEFFADNESPCYGTPQIGVHGFM